MSKMFEFGGKFPWMRRHDCPACPAHNLPLVVMRDGRKGVIHHLKPDGTLAVRPIDAQGNFLPNPVPHWTPEQRAAIPEEVAVQVTDVRPPERDEAPEFWAHITVKGVGG